MTQLFDTETYDAEETTAAAGTRSGSKRHLHSLPTGADPENQSAQWRLDNETIETGRRGLEAARQALQQAARDKSSSRRKAA